MDHVTCLLFTTGIRKDEYHPWEKSLISLYYMFHRGEGTGLRDKGNLW